MNDGIISDVKFEGKGCAISQASASMLTEMVMGKDLTVIKDLKKEDILENIGLTNFEDLQESSAPFFR